MSKKIKFKTNNSKSISENNVLLLEQLRYMSPSVNNSTTTVIHKSINSTKYFDQFQLIFKSILQNSNLQPAITNIHYI